jgi:hypothetical protein
MTRMNSRAGRSRTPEWLRPIWERKNHETTTRITAGMEMLGKERQPVTIASLQLAISAQSGVRVSQSTIQRSEPYQQHRRNAIRHRPAAKLEAALGELESRNRKRLMAKASRLRRENKEGLIAKVLILESALSHQTEKERTLQQEILRLQLESLPLR